MSYHMKTVNEYQTTLKSLENQFIESNDEKMTMEVKINRLTVSNSTLQAVANDLTSQVCFLFLDYCLLLW